MPVPWGTCVSGSSVPGGGRLLGGVSAPDPGASGGPEVGVDGRT